MPATTYKSSLSIKVATNERNQEVLFSVEGEAAPQQGEIDVPDQTTDKEVTITIDKDKLKLLVLASNVDMTFETNDGTTPTDTIDLKAGRAYVWWENDYDTCKITADVTKVFLSNSAGSPGVLWYFVQQDVTP